MVDNILKTLFNQTQKAILNIGLLLFISVFPYYSPKTYIFVIHFLHISEM